MVDSLAEVYGLMLRCAGVRVRWPEFKSKLHQYYFCDLGRITSPLCAFIFSYPICKKESSIYLVDMRIRNNKFNSNTYHRVSAQ